jgi:hypothetical protein
MTGVSPSGRGRPGSARIRRGVTRAARRVISGPRQGGRGRDGHEARRDGAKEGDGKGRAVGEAQEDAVAGCKALRGQVRRAAKDTGRGGGRS